MLTVLSKGIASFLLLGLLCFSSLSLSDQSAQVTDPETIEAVNAIEMLIGKHEYESAIRKLNMVIAEHPENADAWNLLGYSWQNNGDNKQSKKAYAHALDIQPDHKRALECQGRFFLQMGDLNAARRNLERLGELCPNGCEERKILADALARSGA